jgi:hypothetical protein
MMTLINGADHKLLIGASARIIVPTYEPIRVRRDNEDLWVVTSSASSSLGRDTIGPDELVTKAPLERLTDPNLPCHRRPRHYGQASEPFHSSMSLYIRPPSKTEDPTQYVGSTTRSDLEQI